MAVTAWLTFATITSDSAYGSVIWAGLANIASSNDAYATAAISSGNDSQYLKALDPGVTGISSGATIDGHEFEIEGKGQARCSDVRVRIVKDGVVGSTDKSQAGNWGNTDSTRTYGGATDAFGEAWLDTDINSTYGIVFAVTAAQAKTMSVDLIRVRIYYTEAAGGVDIAVNTAVLELVAQAVALDLGTPPAVDIAVNTAVLELVSQAVTLNLGTPSGVNISVNTAVLELVPQTVTLDLGTPSGVNIPVNTAVLELISQAVTLNLGAPPAGVNVDVTVAVLELVAQPVTVQAPGAALLIGQATPLPISVDSLDFIDHTLGTISHSVLASSSPGANSIVLKSDDDGYLRLERLGLGKDAAQPLDVLGNIQLTGDLLHTADLTIEATGGDVLLRNTDLSADNWVSGTTGWGIGYNGNADFRNITADSLTVEAFIADINLALAGSQLVTKSLGIISRPFTVPAVSATLFVYDLPGFENAQVFDDGDYVRLRYIDRSGGGLVVGDAWGTVTLYADLAGGEQSWTWTYVSGLVGQIIGEGAIALDYGASGDGYWHVTTLDAAGSPYAEIGTWVTDPSVGANHTIHVRMGQLDGIAGIGDEWGMWAGQNTANTYLLLSDQNFAAHGMRLSLYESGGAETIRLDPNVPYLAIGSALPSGPDAGGSGLWVGQEGGSYKFRLGDPAGVALRWDGSQLSLRNDANQDVIILDAAGESYFARPMTLGVNGGIWQGSGSFATPTSGLKLWNDAGQGRLDALNNGNLAVSLNYQGLQIIRNPSAGYFSQNALSFKNSSDQLLSYISNLSTGLQIKATGQYVGGGASTLINSQGDGTGAATLDLRANHTQGFPTQPSVTISLVSDPSASQSRIMHAAEYHDFRDMSQTGYTAPVYVGDLHLDGNLVSVKNSTNYDVFATRYLTSQLTSTSWDGDSKTSANNGVIDLSAVFGVPAGVKAVLVRLSSQGGSIGDLAFVGPNSANSNALICRTQVANTYIDMYGVVPCDSNGDVYITIQGTVNVWIRIFGYAL